MCPLYVAGLIGPGDRKSVQPMAARLVPGDYDQLHHFIADGVWDEMVQLGSELPVLLSCMLEGTLMSKKYIPLIYNTPPEGFAWQIMEERKVLKSGTARTQAEANAAAERATRELEDADRARTRRS
jgi:hypothetical protein